MSNSLKLVQKTTSPYITLNEKMSVALSIVSEYLHKSENQMNPILRGMYPGILRTLNTFLVITPESQLALGVKRVNCILECFSGDYDTPDEFSDHVKSLL